LDCNTIDEAIEKVNTWLTFERAEIIGTKVLIGHLAIEKSFWTDEIDDISNELMMPLSSFEGYDYVWMGHVHKPQVFSKNPYVAHIGSMDLTDFGQTEHKKVAILFEKNGFEEIVLPTRPLRRIRLDIPKDENPTKFILNEIDKGDFKNSLVKLEIKLINPDASEINRDEIINRLNKLGAYHICNFSETRSMRIITNEKNEKWQAIEPKAAVKLYADSLEIQEEDEKNDFIGACIEIIEKEVA
jgi:exonuclease SbcD